MGKTIFIGTRKGGTGKTTTAANLGFGLALAGKKTLIIDTDSQHSLTIGLGIKEADKLPITLATVMNNIINKTEFDPMDGLIQHAEGVDLLPANNSLTGIEVALAPLRGREAVLRQYIDKVKPHYDFIIIDTPSTIDLLTVNALAAADSVIIPFTPKYLDAKGLELQLKSIAQVRRQINPTLSIGGILLTMVDRRANFTRKIISLVEDTYGGKIHIFSECIPISVRAAESAAQGISIFTHDPRGRVAAAYAAFTREVLSDVA